jgi:hypothetical protein
VNGQSRIEDGGWRIAILDLPSSILGFEGLEVRHG